MGRSGSQAAPPTWPTGSPTSSPLASWAEGPSSGETLALPVYRGRGAGGLDRRALGRHILPRLSCTREVLKVEEEMWPLPSVTTLPAGVDPGCQPGGGGSSSGWQKTVADILSDAECIPRRWDCCIHSFSSHLLNTNYGPGTDTKTNRTDRVLALVAMYILVGGHQPKIIKRKNEMISGTARPGAGLHGSGTRGNWHAVVCSGQAPREGVWGEGKSWGRGKNGASLG